MNYLKSLFQLILAITLLMTMTTTSHSEVLKPHLYKKKLANGLTLLVKEVPGSKAATVQIWVKAGSIYEEADEAGITHLIEHMIFKGTKTRGAGDVAGDIEEKGGQINAYTSFEQTVYHATLGARYWSDALEVLTDALRNSIFDANELEREKKVVLEEISMRKDQPATQLFQSLMSTAYSKHPYRLPVIGTVESVSSFTREDIINYMEKHYYPANFTVVVVGGVNVKAVVSKVAELFDDMPAKQMPEAILPEEPAQQGIRTFTLAGEINQSHLAMAFPVPAFADPDSAVIDVIATLLGQGETSRLYNELRNKKGLVYRINAAAFTPKYPGLFEVTAILDQKNISAASELVLKEIFKLKYMPIDEEELERIKVNLESDFVFNLERVEGQARVLGSFDALIGDPREDEYLQAIRSVSREDVQRVAQHYFSGRNLTAGILVPQDSASDNATADTAFVFEQHVLAEIVKKAEKKAKAEIPTSLIADSYLSNLHRFHMDNGITLLVREESQVPTVSIRAVFPGGLKGETYATNGAFAFISDLLPKGTEELSSRDLALEIADMAGDISGFNGKNTFGLKGDFLGKFFKDGLKLMRDVLLTPAFDEEEVEKIRPERLAFLKTQEDSLPSLSFREFNRIIFQGHPYGLNTSGSKEVLQKISAFKLREIYKKAARPESLVLSVVGQVKAEEVRDIVAELFGTWANTGQSKNIDESLPPNPPPVPQMFNIPKDKEQTHIIIGFLGTTFHGPDRYALEVLDTVLSGQSGRLFRELRDKGSLAYSLSSFSMMGIDTGSFGIYIGTSPDKKDAAIKGVWQELYKLREDPISREELEKAKSLIIGHYELGLQTHGAQAMDIALSETYHLGQDFGNKYIHELSLITPDDVFKAARKYIQTDHYVLVTVGADNEQ